LQELSETYGARGKAIQLGADEGSGGSDDNGDGELHFDGVGGVGWVVVTVVI
jgi:hypothetical protein